MMKLIFILIVLALTVFSLGGCGFLLQLLIDYIKKRAFFESCFVLLFLIISIIAILGAYNALFTVSLSKFW